MCNNTSQIAFLIALLRSVDLSLLSSLLAVCWRILTSLREFSRRELNPRSFQLLGLRLERLGRELARVLLRHALNEVEASSQPRPIYWEYRTYHPCRRQSRTIETRLGTVYLWEMPQSKQTELTKRLIDVIEGTLQASSKLSLKLRYVTDAGSLPCSFYRKVLSKMKHPVTGKVLKWSWGVDFFHACEYVSRLSDSLFGVGTKESQDWFKEQRHTLRHDTNGVQKVVTRAAQQKRRHGLVGEAKDYNSAKGYLSRYRAHMDYAKRRSEGDPIGSGVTEAGCKVIFNQRMKQSGMRWSKKGGQWIVDLRTACRSRLWTRIWDRYLTSFDQLPEINQAKPFKRLAAA